jgi:hypothetical protein
VREVDKTHSYTTKLIYRHVSESRYHSERFKLPCWLSNNTTLHFPKAFESVAAKAAKEDLGEGCYVCPWCDQHKKYRHNTNHVILHIAEAHEDKIPERFRPGFFDVTDSQRGHNQQINLKSTGIKSGGDTTLSNIEDAVRDNTEGEDAMVDGDMVGDDEGHAGAIDMDSIYKNVSLLVRLLLHVQDADIKDAHDKKDLKNLDAQMTSAVEVGNCSGGSPLPHFEPDKIGKNVEQDVDSDLRGGMSETAFEDLLSDNDDFPVFEPVGIEELEADAMALDAEAEEEVDWQLQRLA